MFFKKGYLFLLPFLLFPFLFVTPVKADVSTTIKNFMEERPTLFFTPEERNALRTTDFQSVFSNIQFIDLDNDNIPEVVLTTQGLEGFTYATIYKYADDTFIKLTDTEGQNLHFYKNNKGELFLSEGGTYNSQGFRYSRIFLQDGSFSKKVLYVDNGADRFYNLLDGKKYPLDTLVQKISLLDPAAKAIVPMDYQNLWNTVSKTYRTAFEQKGATAPIQLLFNNVKVSEYTKPIIKDDTTFIPVRTVTEQFGADILWNEKERSVTIKKDDTTIRLIIDQKTAQLNGKPVQLLSAPIIKDGYTMLPIRFIVESLGGTAVYSSMPKTVAIYYATTRDYYKADLGIFQIQRTNANSAKLFQKTVTVDDIQGRESYHLWVNEPIQNLKITEITYDDGKFTDVKTIFSAPTWDYNTLLLLNTVIPEGLPRLKISYTDGDGLPRTAIVGANALDAPDLKYIWAN